MLTNTRVRAAVHFLKCVNKLLRCIHFQRVKIGLRGWRGKFSLSRRNSKIIKFIISHKNSITRTLTFLTPPSKVVYRVSENVQFSRQILMFTVIETCRLTFMVCHLSSTHERNLVSLFDKYSRKILDTRATTKTWIDNSDVNWISTIWFHLNILILTKLNYRSHISFVRLKIQVFGSWIRFFIEWIIFSPRHEFICYSDQLFNTLDKRSIDFAFINFTNFLTFFPTEHQDWW